MMLDGIEKGRLGRGGASMVLFSIAFDMTVREGRRHSPSIGGTFYSGAFPRISSPFT